MPKHKHTKDKLYYTQEEMRLKYFKNKKKENTYYFLPFNYCCVSLRPLNTCKNICCDREGNLYNKFYFLEYVTKYHKNPITGKKHVSIKDIISLNIAKDKNGNFICPVTLKLLNNNLKIIAIPETGNVFSNMAYQELNVSMNNYRDLINDKPFDKKNVIVLNDPLHKKIVKNFYFQNIEEEKEYMNKLVNNKKEFDKNDNDRNILLDYKYKKIVKDVEKNDIENKYDGIKTLKENNLIYEEEHENENNKNEIEGYDDYLLLKEKINVIINLIRQKGLSNNNIYNNIDEDLYKSMLDLNYEGFYCFMVKEKLWEKYFKFTDLNSITQSDKLSKNNKMSITSTFFQAREDKNIKKKDGIPLFNELKDIYFPLIKRNQVKTYMILTTNISVLNLELWSTRLTETVEKIYNIISNNLNSIKNISYMKLLDDEFLIIEDLNIDIKIEKDKKVQVDKNIIKGPYVGYMTNQKKICFFTNSNKYINKSDIYIIGTVFDKEENENILDIYFEQLKNNNNLNNDINILKLEIINNPFIDAMKEILFQEIKEKYLSAINNNEINNDIKIMKELEKNQKSNNVDASVGKYINKKRASNVDYDTFTKFLNNEC